MNCVANLADFARRDWDVMVIGAGPAGALAAHQVASRGLATLLVECKCFPRDKVCGGCLNRRALAVLHHCGLQGVIAACGGLPIDELCLITKRRTTRFPLPTGSAVSRAALDSELVRAAVSAGASFLPETQAVVDVPGSTDFRCVSVSRVGRRAILRCRNVICADGLSRSSLKRLPGFASLIAPESRIGVGSVLADDGETSGPGQITMLVTPRGYVGMTRLAGNRLSIAAALDPAAVCRKPLSQTMMSLFRTAGVTIPRGLGEARWHGTPLLTSRPRLVAGDRLFLLGDASGYVEPFTGEGISSAFEGAQAVASLVASTRAEWNPSLAVLWEETHGSVMRKKQSACRALSWVLRRPTAAAASLALCRTFPKVAQLVICHVNQPPTWLGQTG